MADKLFIKHEPYRLQRGERRLRLYEKRRVHQKYPEAELDIMHVFVAPLRPRTLARIYAAAPHHPDISRDG